MPADNGFRKGTGATRRRTRRRAGVALLTMATAAAVLPATVAAQDEPDPGVEVHHVPAADDPDPGVEVHDRAESEAIDIAIIAQDKGWSLAATRQHMAAQDAFGDLNEAIESKYGVSG
jgi:hypothetical protein